MATNFPSNHKLLIATRNQGKLRELSVLLKSLPFQLLSLDDFPELADFEVDETGDSYQANAELKAVAYGGKTQVMTIAEDSGLEVMALNSFPGVKSDRWLAGSYSDKNQALLAKLDELGKDVDRSAHFVNVTCLYDSISKSTQFFIGELKGTIATQPSGSDGFGYDPIFIPDGYKQSLAELGQDIKNTISARARAIARFRTDYNQNSS